MSKPDQASAESGEFPHKTSVKIQIRDPGTDEILEERTIKNDFAVVCCGNRFIKSIQIWGSTHQINIARQK